MTLFLLICQLAPSASGAPGTCITAERDALLSFKASLLDPAGRLSSWQGEDCCLWSGVRCNNRSGHVVKLNLRNPHIFDDLWEQSALSLSTGEMSSSLVTLRHLRYMDLSGNEFNGTSIPVFVGSLANLRYLNLSWAGFSGRLPPQLGNLSYLEYLDLSWNYYFDGLNWTSLYLYIVDLTWLPRLSSLSHLDMGQVNLSAARDWVHMVNMLPALKVLRLDDCSLDTTASATSQSNLTHLQVLDLSNNDFSTTLKRNWFWDLTSLKELYLFACSWYGTIPYELGNMTSLQVINFAHNDLVGLLPNNLEHLCNLEELLFGLNNINASIGEFMDRLPRCSWSTLQVLDMTYANMTGELPIWIGNMSSFSILLLPDNMITGIIPQGIGTLGNIKTLDLSYNNFIGPVPTGLGSLHKLASLDLSYNKFNGVLLKEHFSGLLSLDYLDLSHNSLKLDIEPNWVAPFRLKVAGFRSCQLGPRFPEWLRWQTDVDILVLGNASLDDSIPDWFWVTFSRASFLHASGNMLRGSLPANLQHMSADHIYLGSNNLTGQVPLLPINLSRLNLSSNSFSGSLPSELKAPRLEELLLANNKITGTIPSSMCQLTGLKRLDLSGNNLSGDVMQCWNESENKTTVFDANFAAEFGSIMLSLALNNNQLTGEFPRFLQSASQLMFLDLSHNRFSGSLPMWLAEKMPRLQILRVRSNMFSGHIPKSVTHLVSLHYLDIARNNISGTIPWSLSNLKAMKVRPENTEDYVFEESIPVLTKDQARDYTFGIYKLLVNLDLSGNSLTGEIPVNINLLIGLNNLNLSSNQLTGTIPNQIGDLKQLESLDLSYNEFSGEIPSGLSALTSLSHLNLSYNNLSGEIPSGPQLQALDNQIYIYIGNPDLCGHPLSKNCSTNDSKQNVYEDTTDPIASLYLGMSIGFVIGLWTVFCTMLMKRTWMSSYFRIIDKLYDKVYVQVAIIWARLLKKSNDGAE